MKNYQILKAQMFQKWLADLGDDRILLFMAQTLINEWIFTEELKEFLFKRSSEECVYIMTAGVKLDNVFPLYIGKSKHVLRRWESHLNSFFQRKKPYLRWWHLLTRDNNFQYNVYLSVVPQSKIISPPIQGFPMTVGSVEYQLISLASDAYPEYLLNREGNRR